MLTGALRKDADLENKAYIPTWFEAPVLAFIRGLWLSELLVSSSPSVLDLSSPSSSCPRLNHLIVLAIVLVDIQPNDTEIMHRRAVSCITILS